jgi:hypothetical protein
MKWVNRPGAGLVEAPIIYPRVAFQMRARGCSESRARLGTVLRAAARGCLIPDAGPRIADADLSSRRSGEFPRSRMVGDRTVWVEREIDAWIAALPNRQLKGDAS